MSDPESFLSRWSRRKREALRETDRGVRLRGSSAANSSPPPSGEGAGEVVARPARAPADLPFDAASLPPIESITADTDIRNFLASGVPSELTRAALRRAWACDPKIRNFVGPAEYDWDFNAADSMAGFGPLRITDEVGKMAAQILEPGRSAPEAGNLLDPAPTIPKAEQIADENDTEAGRGATAELGA